MTSEIANYDFRGNNVRILTDQDNAPWFIAKDICDVLGTETRDISKILDDDEFSNVDSIHIAQNGGRAPLIVSESGFYKLVMRSRKPVAKEFQRWVTRDVLPSIRKHGAYMTPDTIRQALADPDTLIMLATRSRKRPRRRWRRRSRCACWSPRREPMRISARHQIC